MVEFNFEAQAIVLGQNGDRQGPMRIGEAKALAREVGLDLIEVSRQSGVSVCKIMDRGKWNYEQNKKAKKTISHHHVLKEVKFSLRIDTHDQQVKTNHIRTFLIKGFDVRIVVEMKGRERENRNAAYVKMNDILDEIGQNTFKSETVKSSDNRIMVIIHPEKNGNNNKS